MPEPPDWSHLAKHDLQGLAEIISSVRDIGRRSAAKEVIEGTGFTLRDEANVLTAYAFRNGYLEELHAGASGFSDEEMKKLMIEASARLEQALLAREGETDLYALFLLEYGAAYSSRWDRHGATAKLSRDHFAWCPRCGKRVRTDWKFCASCGATRQHTAAA